jgi:hypothetical protein
MRLILKYLGMQCHIVFNLISDSGKYSYATYLYLLIHIHVMKDKQKEKVCGKMLKIGDFK